MLELARLRADTPGCLDKSFLDSAGSALPPTPVLDAMIGHLRREAEVGGYLAAAEREVELGAVRGSIARLIGAAPGEIALTDSASRAWTTAFDAIVTSEGIGPGDRVLVTNAEYASNAIAMLHHAQRAGFHVELVPNDASGQVDLAALEELLDERVRLISLVHMPSNSGLVNPVRAVVDAAHRFGALVLLDACQTVGQLEIDVASLGVDALTATGRKWLRAPRGTGFLYVRADLLTRLAPSAIDQAGASLSGASYTLQPDARRFEFWEYDVAARLGLGAAADYLLEIGMAEAERAIRANAEALRAGLARVPGLRLRDRGIRPAGIVTFTLARHDPAPVRDRLRAAGVIVTVSPSSSSPLNMSDGGQVDVVRASPHYFTSPADIERCVDAVHTVSRDC
ncbi:aminotransferase class V-fold PLP-dependent enzyme [Tomitella biformata]|uniref:aminotransferase class V-fold PLP-dependent enzyme n=1 Tax=Tomitella biformata TaxID=630403 RepID=UPI000466E286|nr:aminotransferase class V-fold PLP-dependent enzyme [Tomitella biformata]